MSQVKNKKHSQIGNSPKEFPRQVDFDWFDGVPDVEHNGAGVINVSDMFSPQGNFIFRTEPLDRVYNAVESQSY